MNLGYIANHLYRIAGQDKSYYPDDQEDFPTDSIIDVRKLSDDAINGIINSKEYISNLTDFKNKELNFVYSLKEDGNWSYQWLTYGEAMEMREDGWRRILNKLDEDARTKAQEEIRGSLQLGGLSQLKLPFTTYTNGAERVQLLGELQQAI